MIKLVVARGHSGEKSRGKTMKVPCLFQTSKPETGGEVSLY